MLEGDLLHRFNNHMLKLVNLYILAEKYAIEHLKNQAIDAIQDGYNEYGTVFGPGLICKIFTETKKGSTLRDLCIAANIIHIDRGCSKLRTEVMTASMMLPDFMPHMLKWVSRNFIMFGRRHREGFNVLRSMEGFSMLNRAKLCPCHFHEHSPGQAHEGHEGCAVPFLDCSHGEEGEGMEGVA
jgi:hypothetical protein